MPPSAPLKARYIVSFLLLSAALPAFAAIFNDPSEIPLHKSYDYIVVGGTSVLCHSSHHQANLSYT